MIEVRIRPVTNKPQQMLMSLPSCSVRNLELIEALGELGASWDQHRTAWRYDVREDRCVRQLCRAYYGTDRVDCRRCDVRIDLGSLKWVLSAAREIWLFGVCVVRKHTRDAPPEIHESFVLEAGEFEYRSGSRQNPTIGQLDGVVLVGRDVPVQAIEQAREDHPDAFEVIQMGEQPDDDALIISKLRAEVERLQAQLDKESAGR